MKAQKETLDKIDFLPYIKKFKGKDFYLLVTAVEDDYNGTALTKNEFLEGFIFNWYSESELLDYLTERYPKEFKYQEVTQYVIC